MKEISRSKKLLEKLRKERPKSHNNRPPHDMRKYNVFLMKVKRENNLKLIRSIESAKKVILNH